MRTLPEEMSFAQLPSYLLMQCNATLGNYSPVTLVVCTAALFFLWQKMVMLYQHWNTREVKKAVFNNVVSALTHLPVIGLKIQHEIDKEVKAILSGVAYEVDEARSQLGEIYSEMPEQGISEDTILNRVRLLHKQYQAGRLSGAVYTKFDERQLRLLSNIWAQTALTNPMHSEWPLLNLMEAEVISMCAQLLHGEKETTGIMTHGGSTSILEACKAYVFLARKNGITHPDIIVPDTAHVAFDKAAAILNVQLIKVPINPDTGAADVSAMERAITCRTCMMVGSAPSFPAGVIDPIESLGEIAKRHQIPLHVDACLGGFVSIFAREAGFEIPPCDFSVLGVTSISIDTHKYGQTPKGSSVLLFSPKTQATPTHVHLDWVGGMYVTPGIDGSRSGADIATTWTVLCYNGKQKYIADTQKIIALKNAFVEAVNQIDGIFVPYQPQLSVIPIQSRENINILLIADRLRRSGWSVNILQSPDQKAAGFHFCLTSVHANKEDFLQSFIADLNTAVQYANNNPLEKPTGMAKAYGKLEKGVPGNVQERIGYGYVRIFNTIRENNAVGRHALVDKTTGDLAMTV